MRRVVAPFVLSLSVMAALEAAPRVDPAQTLMASLRSELDRIRSAKPTDAIELDHPPDVGRLVGRPDADLRRGLGDPDVCSKHKPSGCAGADEWVYHFYHLPSNRVGGGPQLELKFDTKRRCSSAGWVYTQ